jgi:hypothetical protein
MNGNKRMRRDEKKIDKDKRDQRCFHFPHLIDFNLIYVWAKSALD